MNRQLAIVRRETSDVNPLMSHVSRLSFHEILINFETMPDSLNPHSLIAFVSNSAWSVYNFRMDVIRHLIGQGFEVVVLASDDEYSQYLVENGCRFIPIHFNNRTANPIQDYSFYRQLKRLYSELRPGFVFHF